MRFRIIELPDGDDSVIGIEQATPHRYQVELADLVAQIVTKKEQGNKSTIPPNPRWLAMQIAERFPDDNRLPRTDSGEVDLDAIYEGL